MDDRQLRPIFVVGMPRSGTTFLHHLMASHPDLCTTTRSTRDFPTSVTLCRLMRLLGKPDTIGEGGYTWDRFLRHGHDGLEAGDVTPRSRRFYRTVVETHLKYHRKTRFLSRYPANALRIGFLREIFPDAFFVHMVRDGRAVCRSVLQYREKDGTLHDWWGIRPPGWRELEKLPPFESVAHQWVEVVRAVRVQGEGLPADRYMELRYEDLAASPAAEVDRFCRHCELAPCEGVATAAASDMKSQNYKWQQAFSETEVETLTGIMRGTLQQFGYT